MWPESDNLLVFLLAALFLLYFIYAKRTKSNRFNTLAAQYDSSNYKSYPIIGHSITILWKYRGLTGPIKALADYRQTAKPIGFWFGPKFVICINKPEHLEIVFNSGVSMNKPREFFMFKDIFSGGLIFTDNPQWRRDRKLMNGNFKQKILESHVDIFTKHVEHFVANLQMTKLNHQFDIHPFLRDLFFNIFFETSVGVNPDKYREEFLDEMEKGVRLVMMRLLNPLYHIDFIYRQTNACKEVNKSGQKLRDIMSKVYDSRLREYQEEFNKRGKTVFLDYLIDLHLRENAFTKDAILSELILFTFGGYDTCTISSSFIFLTLGMHQDIQEKAFHEVMQVLGPDRRADYNTLSKLTYLVKVIKETMRLFPVGPSLMRRIDEELDLGDCVIPAPSPLILNVFGLHRNEQYYQNPLKFDPERFSPDEMDKRHRYAYLPFSGGPRKCIGIKFAMLSLTNLFANVVRKFRIETAYKSVESIQLEQSMTLNAVDGYPITLHSRN